MLRQPGGEGLKVEGLAGATGVDELQAGQQHQRMHGVVTRLAAGVQCLLCATFVQAALGEECGDQVVEIQPVVMGGGEVHTSSLGFKASARHIPVRAVKSKA